MQVKFFQIPSGGCAAIEAEMNASLRSQRKRRGHGRLDRVKTGLLDRNLPSETKEHAKTHTGGASSSESLRIGETRCAPLLKSKSKLLLL